MTTAVKVTPRRSNLIPLIHQSPQQWPRWCYGWQPYWRSPFFLLYRRNNRLKIFLFIFLRESERGEAAGIEKKTLHLVFHIQAWPASLKEPLRCGFKRNTLCGTGVGSEPSMEETLQCVAARGASDLACHLKMGAGNGTGTVHFSFFFFLLLFLFRYFYCFCSPREDFSDSSPVSRSLSGSTNILSWFWEHKCVCLYTCLLYVADAPTIPVILPFQHLPPPSPCPLAAKLLCSTQLYHFCRVEWKKGKAGIL